jgi:hypothetical protein
MLISDPNGHNYTEVILNGAPTLTEPWLANNESTISTSEHVTFVDIV